VAEGNSASADTPTPYRIIDVVAPLVPAVKPQAAFFEQLGSAGMTALKETIDYKVLFETHRAATAKAIGKAMRGEPDIAVAQQPCGLGESRVRSGRECGRGRPIRVRVLVIFLRI
jgi:hypothetical protein